MTIEYEIAATSRTYYLPAQAMHTAITKAWAIAPTNVEEIGQSPSALDAVRDKYRVILDSLPIRQTHGNTSVLLAELRASAETIAEAETLSR